jgi:hypothetical protein
MKKLVLIMVAMFGFLSCENPSVEEGLARLEASLAELEAAMSGVDVNQMIADIATMQDQVETMENDVDLYARTSRRMGISNSIYFSRFSCSVQEIIDNAGTKDQVADILVDLEATQAMIDQLVLLADYDYDGVINGLDQCPDTELFATVNEQGCSEIQLAAIESATASSTTVSSTEG